MITESDIEKLIFRCLENYWNTRMSKKHNLGRVSKIAANDIWQLLMQHLPNKQSIQMETAQEQKAFRDAFERSTQNQVDNQK